MTPTTKMTAPRKQFAMAALALAVITGASTSAMARLTLTPHPTRLAQATPPLQSTPGAESKPSVPSEPTTTGQRPQETPPQPARPDAEARDAGAKPALPPAPAEKVAPPITAK
ncbi:hypothetical protein [Tardiphaga sp. P9-11]|uniref:hypothetical protein n=1 Tax=Tardiphaga sp. P9-11 TaxID=2024614 RepID=UPI0011F341D1|nr:hypothetical protein [Tardiphaga sp. P9-11]KAA0073858.1 hypothetical protein CIW50_18020 [Tardiphaga sp. P9-11]